MKIKLIVTAVSMILIFVSCNYNKTGKENLAFKDEPAHDFDLQSKDKLDKSSEENKQIPIGKFNGINDDSLPTSTTYVDWDKKIIKKATLRLEIKDFKNYNSYVNKVTKQYGSYITQEAQDFSIEKLETTITIKVPVAQFESLMNSLPAENTKVLEKRINAEDVGGEIADTRSRLETKKQMRLKYLDFLKQSKNISEVLQVQNEINDIQEEIESATGRMNYLSHQTAYSTVDLSFYEPLDGFTTSNSSPTFLTRIANSFKTGMNWIVELFIGLIAVWPLLLLIAGGYFLVKNIRQKRLALQKIQTGTKTT